MTTPMRLYFDHNATTPVKPAVRAAMLAAWDEVGNASSVHSFGRAARAQVERARAQVAALVNAGPKQVIFNSGATEGNNTILRGFAGQPIFVSATEHASVYETGKALGAKIIPVKPNGIVDLSALQALLAQASTGALVSVMLVNNETGVIQPLADVAALVHAAGALLHVDAVQAAGKIPIDLAALGADFLTLSAHKFGGPQGVGAILMSDGARACVPVPVLLTGGGQEQRQRAGTENVAGIVGMGVAAELAQRDLPAMAAMGGLRDLLEQALKSSSHRVRLHGAEAPRVATTTAFSVEGFSADVLLMNLDLMGVAVSSGSACSSGTVKPSHVLQAMGVPEPLTKSALRISLGWTTTAQDIDRLRTVWQNMMARLEASS